VISAGDPAGGWGWLPILSTAGLSSVSAGRARSWQYSTVRGTSNTWLHWQRIAVPKGLQKF